MTTLKIYKHNGFIIRVSKEGSNVYVKATKKIPIERFKKDISAQSLINLS